MIKKLLLFVLAFYFLGKFCHKETDGFALAKVSTYFLEEDLPSIEAIPAATFRYLGKGGQSYIFVSEDDRYVLKLFRSSRLNILKLLPFEKQIAKQENRIRQTLQSYSIADRCLKEETGLIGVHLTKAGHLSTQLKIIDKLGIVHPLNPNDYPFIIQEKAVLVKERISQLMNSGNLLEAKQALSNLFALIEERKAKGIGDGDANVTKNFGFCGDRAIQIDGGRFSLSPCSNEKLQKSTEELLRWIDENYPQLGEQLEAI